MIVGAPPPVRRVKPEYRAGRCSHPGRVLLRRRRVLIVGAPPSVRRVKPEHRASPCSHPGRVLLRWARADCRSTALGAKGEAETPNQPLFAPGAGAPTVEACVDCRSTALGAKGKARTPSRPLFAPGAGAPTQEARA